MTKDWGKIDKAKILLIGHDPRLQNSDTIAEYCFFADYFFNQIPVKISERKKYDFAKSTFDYIDYITCSKYKNEEIYITNLCNVPLMHAPKGKTVLIPKDEVISGINRINELLSNSNISFVFPMSLQVNYWLQKFNFYYPDENFLFNTAPKEKGLINNSPYFEPQRTKTFQAICGNIYDSPKTFKIIPILHPKNFPLKGKFNVYKQNYDNLINYFKIRV